MEAMYAVVSITGQVLSVHRSAHEAEDARGIRMGETVKPCRVELLDDIQQARRRMVDAEDYEMLEEDFRDLARENRILRALSSVAVMK